MPHSFPARCAHRKIDLRNIDGHTAVGWVEDDFHHFGVTVRHASGLVTGVSMEPTRYPWATCPGAAQPLQALLGQRLVQRASDIGGLIDMRRQCTHVFDLTGLVLAHAFAERAPRRYHAIVEDRAASGGPAAHNIRFGRGACWLLCDAQAVQTWALEGDMFTAQDGECRSLGQGFRAWSEGLDDEAAEQAFILRRAILVAGGRALNHDDYRNADAMQVPALCHSFQPGVREIAWRMAGTTRDHAQSHHALLAHLNPPGGGRNATVWQHPPI